MKIEKFEDIIAWQKSEKLVIEIYDKFRHCRDYIFKDQICRAVISIMNNIAEGFERRTNNDFKRFLYIAKGSCAEVRSMLYLAKGFDYITEKDFKKIHQEATEISKILSGFIKTL